MSRADDAAFAAFAAARHQALQRAAYLMVGDVQLAQDLIQEALTKTYVAWGRLRVVNNAEAYTRKVITTTAISWFRRKSWNAERVVDLMPERPMASGADDVAQREWVWQALQQLPARQRAAIVLRYYEDLTEAQTAEAMDCAVGTVKSQVASGLRKLREHLGEEVQLLSVGEMKAVLA